MSSLSTQEAIDLTIQCVPCPNCKALIGEKCTSKMGKKLGANVCVGRRLDMIAFRRVKGNKIVYKQKREEIAAKRSKPLPPSLSSRLLGD